MQNSTAEFTLTDVADQLRAESDPSKRKVLRDRFIQEENKFGRRSEQADLALEIIARCTSQISLLERLLASANGDGSLVDTHIRVLHDRVAILRWRREWFERDLAKRLRASAQSAP